METKQLKYYCLKLTIFIVTILIFSCQRQDKRFRYAPILPLKERIAWTKKHHPKAEIVINHEKDLKKKPSGQMVDLVFDMAIKERYDDSMSQLERIGEPVIDHEGNIYIAGRNKIWKYTSDWRYLKTIGKKGSGPGEFLMGVHSR